MPMPVPKKGQSEKEFISVCMADGVMSDEFPDQGNRLAVCYGIWKRRKKKKKEKK